MLHSILKNCTGQAVASCWPAGGRCAVANVCSGLDQRSCTTATLADSKTQVGLACACRCWTTVPLLAL